MPDEDRERCPICKSTDIVRMRWDEENKIMYIVCCNPECKAKGIQEVDLNARKGDF